MTARAVSFVVHSFNEADALGRLVRSSLPLVGLFDEWVILDHRSDDHTAAVIEALRPLLADAGVSLTALHEPRDLSARHTFADVRNRALDAAQHEVALLLDADFVLGRRFGALLQRGVRALQAPRSPYYGAAFSVPCVWDRLRTDATGRVVEHGRVWVHQLRPRILWRAAVHYTQTGDGGRWEHMEVAPGPRQQRLDLTQNRKGTLTPHTVVSVNVKPAERIALRDTMTMFMQDAIQGAASGEWLENYRAGTVRQQPPYPFQKRSLKGWELNVPALELAA
jgi:hypothetical protein